MVAFFAFIEVLTMRVIVMIQKLQFKDNYHIEILNDELRYYELDVSRVSKPLLRG
jgi:hypothetical protein